MIPFKIVFKRARPLLGTFFEIKAYSKTTVDDVETELKITKVFELAAKLESIFSVFDQDSDLSRFNQAQTGDRVLVSKDFYDLLQLALQIDNFSENSFTCFSSSATHDENNPLALIEPKGSLSCATYLCSDSCPENQIWIQKNTTQKLDLNGIAKGFVVDQLAAKMKLQLPNLSGLINAGGDLRFFNEAHREIY